MSNNTTKLQVPMDKDIRDALEARARSLGFDSAQAYIRVWAKAQAEGRTVNFGEDDWGEPSPEAVARWDQQIKEMEAEEKTGTAKSFDTLEGALEHLDSL